MKISILDYKYELRHSLSTVDYIANLRQLYMFLFAVKKSVLVEATLVQ